MTALSLNLFPVVQLTDDDFYNLCQANRDLRLELTAKGELIVMSPTEGEGGRQKADLIVDLGVWSRQTELGIAFTFQSQEGPLYNDERQESMEGVAQIYFQSKAFRGG